MATEIESLLDYVVNVGGTELLVTEGAPSAVRLAGKVCSIPDAPAVEPGALREFLGSIEGESGSIIGGPWANARWRVRYFRSALGTSAVFRPLMEECPGFGDLGAPQTLNNLLGLSSGLVVFAGPACAGKTTTATSYVSALCESRMMRVCFLDAAGEYSVRTGECLVLANSSGSSSDKMATCSGWATSKGKTSSRCCVPQNPERLWFVPSRRVMPSVPSRRCFPVLLLKTVLWRVRCLLRYSRPLSCSAYCRGLPKGLRRSRHGKSSTILKTCRRSFETETILSCRP